MADEPPTPPKPGPPLPPQPEALLNLGFRSTVADGQPSGPEDPTALQPQPAAPIDAGMEQAGDFIGSYKLIERLGVGGFGVVWRAEQHEPIHREVALKLIKPGMDSREIIARFEAERQALALMDHPNIASVLDAGATARGRPYFVMELVKGVPITKYCDEHKLTIRERLELFIPVCQAVQHAHQKAILHRDLKPSNILVTEVDGKPVPKVIDFGVAKALGATPEEALKASLLRTLDGMVVGTPQYMSPEQAGSVPDVDTRSDLYTLGVILYELLTGQTPVTREQLRNAAFHEVLRLVRQGEARRPSSGFMPVTDFARTAAQMRQSDARKLSHAIRGDLDWIVLKALEKDRARRYETANAFALDLRRHLEDEPVSAGPPSVAYWLGKLARRHKVILGNAAAALLVIAAFAVWFVFNVTHEREVALGERDRANAASIETAAAKGKTETALIASREAEKKAVASEKQANEKKAELDRKNAEYRKMLVESARSDRLIAEEKLRTGKEREAFAHLARACEYDPLSTLAAEKAVVALNNWNLPPVAILVGEQLEFSDASRSMSGPDLSNVQFSPDGTRIVTASDDKTARVWDAATGESLATLAGHKGPVSSAHFSPDGTRVVASSYHHREEGSPDYTARVWDAATGKALLILTGSSAHFSPNGKRIVTAPDDKTARVWDAATGKTLLILKGHKEAVSSARFSPDGSRIITTSGDVTARAWDAATGKAIGFPFDISNGEYGGEVGNVDFSPDGKRIVSPSNNDEGDKPIAQVRDAATGVILVTFKGHEHGTRVYTAQFSPDGKRIVTASDDKTARVWDAATGKTLAILAGHEELVASAQFSPDGSRIVTVSDDKTVRVWDAAMGKVPSTRAGEQSDSSSAEVSPDGTRVVIQAAGDHTARAWDAATGKTLAILAGREGLSSGPQFSLDGARGVASSGSEDNTARVWDVATGATLAILVGHKEDVLTAQFSPDGSRIVTGSHDVTARVWEAATGKSLFTLVPHTDKSDDPGVWCAEFSPDGSRIVTANNNGSVQLWDAATGKAVATIAVGRDAEGREYDRAQFSPDGSRIFTGDEDKFAHWTILPPTAGPPPEWFPDFLRYRAQMRLTSDGELETLKTQDWLALREKLRGVRRASAGQDTPYLRILRRFVPE